MRKKGTILEVVIYTTVVESFCKAQKMDDAKRIFRKMLNNVISFNAFSYTILIQVIYKGKRLEDTLDLCVEMLEVVIPSTWLLLRVLPGKGFRRSPEHS
ncbi:Pentatricopeptide repeat-containing protein [Camellia lanceoleosa]|uniref:Pentatricopeptide repeat-containing protein n=1 Tax=Camellia lanceoleosa TaxID=1840588 RepID=A0ACC0ISE0_9ERIC|nr:Pentatricopeptide repeat-containing protein [Camellia lanceoleosa]